jgi:hypothetical protein
LSNIPHAYNEINQHLLIVSTGQLGTPWKIHIMMTILASADSRNCKTLTSPDKLRDDIGYKERFHEFVEEESPSHA